MRRTTVLAHSNYGGVEKLQGCSRARTESIGVASRLSIEAADVLLDGMKLATRVVSQAASIEPVLREFISSSLLHPYPNIPLLNFVVFHLRCTFSFTYDSYILFT